MRVAKKVLSRDSDAWLTCCWDECQRPGYDLHKITVNYGTGYEPHLVKYVFCSEKHRNYWGNGHRSYGNLPAGFRLSAT